MSAETGAPQGAGERRFLVVWQDSDTREFVWVGEFVAFNYSEGSRAYEFRYTEGAVTHPRFRPFPAFPRLDQIYRQEQLFAFLQNRIMSPRRPDYLEYVAALGLDPGHPDPVELLARTGGERATDTIQLVPAPTVQGDREELHFLVSGVRHVDPQGVRLAELEPGADLHVRPEPENEFDPAALLLDMRTGEPVGYVPSYLLGYVHKQRELGAEIAITVEQVNGPEVPAHLRMLCRMEVKPPRGAAEVSAVPSAA